MSWPAASSVTELTYPILTAKPAGDELEAFIWDGVAGTKRVGGA
jgi:hypothetical protein